MSTSRRRFFGFAAVPVAAALPAITAPAVKMHDGDIAPVPPHYCFTGFEWRVLKPKSPLLFKVGDIVNVTGLGTFTIVDSVISNG